MGRSKGHRRWQEACGKIRWAEVAVAVEAHKDDCAYLEGSLALSACGARRVGSGLIQL